MLLGGNTSSYPSSGPPERVSPPFFLRACRRRRRRSRRQPLTLLPPPPRGQMVSPIPGGEGSKALALAQEGQHKNPELLGEGWWWGVCGGVGGWGGGGGLKKKERSGEGRSLDACAWHPQTARQPRRLVAAVCRRAPPPHLPIHTPPPKKTRADVDGLPHPGAAVWPGQQYYNAVDRLTGRSRGGKLKGEETAVVEQARRSPFVRAF